MPCSLVSCHRKLSQGIAENKNKSVQKETPESYEVEALMLIKHNKADATPGSGSPYIVDW